MRAEWKYDDRFYSFYLDIPYIYVGVSKVLLPVDTYHWKVVISTETHWEGNALTLEVAKAQAEQKVRDISHELLEALKRE